MKIHNSTVGARMGLFAVGATAWFARKATLQDAGKDDFYIGVAINPAIATDTAVRA